MELKAPVPASSSGPRYRQVPAGGAHRRRPMPAGVDATTGRYLATRPPAASDLLADPSGLAPRGIPLDPRGICSRVDAADLAQAGWGVVFPQSWAEKGRVAKITAALGPLLDLRQRQAAAADGRLFRTFSGKRGYRQGETFLDFLTRNGMGPGQADPVKVPYYLMLVGSPQAIPFDFQFDLAVQHAVGRLHFDSIDGYARYAAAVVDAEHGLVRRSRRIALFGAQSQGDFATEFSNRHLIRPLAEELPRSCMGWTIDSRTGPRANSAALATLFSGRDQPAVLMTASHGIRFPLGDERQEAEQGAVLCSDWPGPCVPQPVERSHYFAAGDLTQEADVAGLIVFQFACFGAGTPAVHSFERSNAAKIAPHPFVARLPARALAHPRGGALAWIGHVDLVWGYSFYWSEAGPQTQAYSSLLTSLLDGNPVGHAMEAFGQRAASLQTALAAQRRRRPDPELEPRLTELWTAYRDARSFAILGDPAVRAAVPRRHRRPDRPDAERNVRSGSQQGAANHHQRSREDSMGGTHER